MPPPRRFPARVKWLITVLILVSATVLIFTQLPRNIYSTDLSTIGQGKPALVIIRDVSFVLGAEVMEYVAPLREEWGETLLFLVAHQGYPEGVRLAARLQVRDGALVLFDGDGLLMQVLHTPRSTQQIREFLREHLPTAAKP